MKFTCDQAKLSKALNIVSKAVTSRTTLPILKGILLEVSADGKLTMSASDLDISIQNTIDVENAEEGSVIVMARMFGDIVRDLPSAEVTVETGEESDVFITCGNSSPKVVGMSADEFPVVKGIEEEKESMEIDVNIFRRMIDKTAFAASIDLSRGVITGVLIEMANNEINMVAIDGYRMAINKSMEATPFEKKIIVSAKTLSDLARIIGEVEAEESVGKLYLGDKKIVFRYGNVQAEVRLMEGEFINYKEVLPKENKTFVEVNKTMLLESLRIASHLVKGGRNKMVRLNIQDTLITVTSNSEEGSDKEEIPVNKVGEDISIGFNVDYLMAALKAIDEEMIKMSMNSPINPCVITPVDGEQFTHLILPVRIN